MIETPTLRQLLGKKARQVAVKDESDISEAEEEKGQRLELHSAVAIKEEDVGRSNEA